MKTLADPDAVARTFAAAARPGKGQDAACCTAVPVPEPSAGPSPTAVFAASAAVGAADGLGPLTDPTPAEKALSLLRAAMDQISLAWPERGSVSLSLIVVEEEALRMSGAVRRGPSSPEATALSLKTDTVACASLLVASTIRAERDRRMLRSAYYAERVTEELSWVGKARDGVRL